MVKTIKKKYILFAIVVIPLFCEVRGRCWPKFSYQGHDLYLRNANLTTIPCFGDSSHNYLELDFGGIDGGGELFIDLTGVVPVVHIAGEAKVVGEPKYKYFIHPWSWPHGKKDSIYKVYSQPEQGRFYYPY